MNIHSLVIFFSTIYYLIYDLYIPKKCTVKVYLHNKVGLVIPYYIFKNIRTKYATIFRQYPAYKNTFKNKFSLFRLLTSTARLSIEKIVPTYESTTIFKIIAMRAYSSFAYDISILDEDKFYYKEFYKIICERIEELNFIENQKNNRIFQWTEDDNNERTNNLFDISPKFILNQYSPELFKLVKSFLGTMSRTHDYERFIYNDMGMKTLKAITEEGIPLLYAQQHNLIPPIVKINLIGIDFSLFDYIELGNKKIGWTVKTPLITYTDSGECRFNIKEFIENLQYDISQSGKVLLNTTYINLDQLKYLMHSIDTTLKVHEKNKIIAVDYYNKQLCGNFSYLKSYLFV